MTGTKISLTIAKWRLEFYKNPKKNLIFYSIESERFQNFKSLDQMMLSENATSLIILKPRMKVGIKITDKIEAKICATCKNGSYYANNIFDCKIPEDSHFRLFCSRYPLFHKQ